IRSSPDRPGRPAPGDTAGDGGPRRSPNGFEMRNYQETILPTITDNDYGKREAASSSTVIVARNRQPK
ncbi:MAG: hypothetical protein PHR35_17900, partial [Kiritimatiellae bacterium]|nr:hypothetical protein [Kiritimatiellia bacterium]